MRRFAALVLSGVLLALLGAWAGPSTAYACSCKDFSDAEYAEQADVIFTGTVVDDQQGTPRTLSFAVDRVYKGTTTRTQSLTTGTCGLEIRGEGPFLVFAQQQSTGLTAGLCGGTRAGSVPAALGPGQPPQADPTRAGPGPLAGRVVPVVGLVLAASAAGLVGSTLIRRRPR